jgi:hypothetical protein
MLKDTKNRDKKTLQSTQLKFCKLVAVPMLTYASEMKIDSVEMRFLRPVTWHTLLDHKRSTGISSELKVFNMTEIIERQKEKYERISRMTTD